MYGTCTTDFKWMNETIMISPGQGVNFVVSFVVSFLFSFFYCQFFSRIIISKMILIFLDCVTLSSWLCDLQIIKCTYLPTITLLQYFSITKWPECISFFKRLCFELI